MTARAGQPQAAASAWPSSGDWSKPTEATWQYATPTTAAGSRYGSLRSVPSHCDMDERARGMVVPPTRCESVQPAGQSRNAASSRSQGLGCEALRRQAAEGAHGGADLLQIAVTAVSFGEVFHEPALVRRCEGAVEVGGDQFHELVAVHAVATLIQCCSRAARRADRPRCSSTRWLAALIANRSHTSSLLWPATSRKVTTTRCRAGRPASAAARWRRVSAATAPSSGDGQAGGELRQCPGYGSFAPRNRLGSTVGKWSW